MMALNDNKAVSETDLWDWLKTSERILGRDLHLSRIENLVGTGDPDVRGTWQGRHFDIELKTADRPARDSTYVLNSGKEYIRASQKVWHRCEWLAGGSCFVLLQIGRRYEALRYLIPGGNIGIIENSNEDVISRLSVIDSTAYPSDIIKRAATYRPMFRPIVSP